MVPEHREHRESPHAVEARLVTAERPNLPFLLVTAYADVEDAVSALQEGADDYLTKPCSFAELKARIVALLRRSGTSSTPDQEAGVFDDGHLVVDVRRGLVKRQGVEVSLSPTETRLLMYLVSQRGRIVPHRELLVRVWGSEYAKEMSYPFTDDEAQVIKERLRRLGYLV